MKNTKTLYTDTNGKRTFTGVINPSYEENQITLFDAWNVDEVEQPNAPEGINLNLFKTMSSFLGIPQPKTIKRQK